MESNVVRVRSWLSNAALPLWSDIGMDRRDGGFVERLTLDGEPDLNASKRLRVQARQIYVFSHAALLGLDENAVAAAAHGYRFLIENGCPDGIEAGFVHALHRDGTVADDRRDSYDHAFILFALSWYHRATGDPAIPALLRRVTDTIWQLLRHPGGEGFLIDTRGSLELHQNPHMHLFEAMLAAFDATQDAWFLDRANELFTLFRTRIFDREHGVVREFHDAQWQPLAGGPGRIVEPGHHCEWVWLLKRHADRTGAALCEEAWQLFDFAERHGRPGGGTLLCDQLRPDGSLLKASTRSWPQTEAIKADIAIAECRKEASARTDAIIDALFDHFLDPAPKGGWIDWIDAEGTPLVQAMPASTFYHLFLAFSEYLASHEPA